MERTPSSFLKSPNDKSKRVSVWLVLTAAHSARMGQKSTQEQVYKGQKSVDPRSTST